MENVPAQYDYLRNINVDIHNDRTIAEAEHEYIADDSITGYSKKTELVNARNKLHRLSAVETAGLAYSIKLKCKIPNMVTANIDVCRRWLGECCNRSVWTPVHPRTATINISGAAKCKCKQFPMVPARAITVHKSQGATFDEIFYDNNKSQHNKLVYVGFCRVQTLEGFYLTNKNFIFNHAKRTTAPNIKEINDECLRLDRHSLKTF
ncbi:hypothetical protein AVEN_179383-1, partial [Araneus ventricosus]